MHPYWKSSVRSCNRSRWDTTSTFVLQSFAMAVTREEIIRSLLINKPCLLGEESEEDWAILSTAKPEIREARVIAKRSLWETALEAS